MLTSSCSVWTELSMAIAATERRETGLMQAKFSTLLHVTLIFIENQKMRVLNWLVTMLQNSYQRTLIGSYLTFSNWTNSN